MTEAILTCKNLQQQNSGEGFLFSHLCKKRKMAAKVFPHCGEHGYPFIRAIQGQKLSAASLRALKRI